jgi:predicted transcriptional regulator of viral defense system
MVLPRELRILLDKTNGIITNKQASEVGFSRERLRLLVQAGGLERVASGVYISPDALPDRMYVEQRRKPMLIYSHDTALFLHDLTDRDPIGYSVTVPRGYNAPSLRKGGFTVFTVKPELHQLATIRKQTMFGHFVTTYSLERTVCDCIRSRNRMDIAVVTDAIRRYVRRSDKNLSALMQMAEVFRITSPLRRYMEVLL